MLLPETGNRVVIGVLVCRKIAKRQIVIAGLFDGSRTGHANAVAVHQQADEQKRVIRRQPPSVAPLVLGINRRQVQFVANVRNEAGQVILWKPLL